MDPARIMGTPGALCPPPAAAPDPLAVVREAGAAARVAGPAAAGVPDVLGTLRHVDRELVRAGWHPIPDAWWDVLSAGLESRVMVVRGGRRCVRPPPLPN